MSAGRSANSPRCYTRWGGGRTVSTGAFDFSKEQAERVYRLDNAVEKLEVPTKTWLWLPKIGNHALTFSSSAAGVMSVINAGWLRSLGPGGESEIQSD